MTTPPQSHRQRLHQVVHHLEHLLPGQAPLHDFVHHNTLHGYQHLPFPQALSESRKITGLSGYLRPESFRTLLQEGRIALATLTRVVFQDPELQADLSLGPCRRGDLFLAALCHDITPLSPCRLAWEMAGEKTLTRLRADVPAAQRQKFLDSARQRGQSEAAAVAALWQSCLELLELEAATPPSADADMTAPLAREGERLHHQLMEQVGTSLTLSGLLLSITGQDTLAEVRPYLVRQLSGFLDQGMAPWPLPEREQGFYTAWRRMALSDPGYRMEDLPDWLDMVENLPEEAADAVAYLLSLLGLPDVRWQGYLERLALELPGWSGMFLWRHLRPGYQGLVPARVEMLDYLAVRLVLERLTALRLCRRQWRLEPRLEVLGWHFHNFPAELVLRWHLFNSRMPEHLACRVQMLLRHTDGHTSREEWQQLAHQFLAWQARGNGQDVRQHTVHGHAWPLFLLAQYLGLDGETLKRGGGTLAEHLLATLSTLEEERAGYLWLQAYEQQYRDTILAAVAANRGRGRWAQRRQRPQAQLVFCMDDREEAIRRHLEECNPAVETLGAAGFFGVPMNWQGLDDTRLTPLCPVVVTPVNTVREEPQAASRELAARHHQRRNRRLTLRDRLLRRSHQGVVTPTLITLLAAPLALLALFGKLLLPLQLGRLLQKIRERVDLPVPTALNFTAPPDGPDATPQQPRAGFTDTEQANRVEGLLRTMGLTYGFAPLVVILGHGSNSQNNPHLAAYDCGACSGRHGGPNGRLFAAMANRPEVRRLLAQRGLAIPADSWFIGAEHNTGDETITWYDGETLPPTHRQGFDQLCQSLDQARALSAHERCRRLVSAPRHPTPGRALNHVVQRTMDFSQARPELGHVTNAVAMIGRRSLTQGVFFDRRMFLISYDPTQDPDGKIAESILLAAGPVGAGISLEYYFSTVDNDRFGCGTKVMHNVTGFLGVMDGTSSDLRTGLPRQMVEIHEAMRLLVIVEQTPAILTAICQRQPVVAELVVHGWIQLASLDPVSGAIHSFHPGEGWQPWQGPEAPTPRAESSPAWYAHHQGPLPPALIRQPGEPPHG